MKAIFKSIFYMFMLIRIKCLFLKSRLLGDHVINKYIKNCSERIIKHVLVMAGVKLDMSSNVKAGLTLDNTYFNYKNLTIGNNCFIGRNVFIDMVMPITICDEAVISEGVTILTHQDVGNRVLKKYYERKTAPVILGEGSWIGANATILCGVKIGKCAVVAAGSVVTKDVPDFTVVGGVPARFIKLLEQ